MRKIKFRAWDKKNKQMTTSFDVTSQGVVKSHFGSPKYHPDYLLMQYTEVKDIDGKRVYEGDVVEVLRTDSFKPYKAEVYFSYGCFGTQWKNGFTGHIEFIPIFDWRVGVVGNIYENPELI